jgi:CRISPR-associated endonuclease/helicase Cas3
MAPAFLQCDSHPGRLLTEHLLDVRSRLAGTDDWLELAALCHDVGKATEFFQRYLYGASTPQELRRHAELGAFWLLEILQSADSANTARGSSVERALAFAFVLRHHGRLGDLLDDLTLHPATPARISRQLAGMDAEGLRGWLRECTTICPPAPAPTPETLTALRVRVMRELRATHDYGEAVARFQLALRSFGRLIEADRDSAAGLSEHAAEPSKRLTADQLAIYRASLVSTANAAPDLLAVRERVYQSSVLKAGTADASSGRLWSLTVPTGAGKTLAAMGWALHRRATRLNAGMPCPTIIYALPFTAIIDQTASVLRDVWQVSDADGSTLAVHHHLAEMGDLANRGEESLARQWVEAWRADVVCTTFVQVVNAMFHGTCADARRLHRLAGSILILDEVQAFPAELWPVLRRGLKSLSANLGTDILLVTATQPALFTEQDRIEIGPDDLPAHGRDVLDRYDVDIDVGHPTTLKKLAERIATEMVAQGRNTCLVIANTVREALELYHRLYDTRQAAAYQLFHLSTNLRPKDREGILGAIRGCRGPHILVATQVVEAGVDLSFELVYRALAPLDSVVQAAGRCNRHGLGDQRGVVHLVDLDGNSGVAVYGRVHMAVARDLLTGAVSTRGMTVVREPQMRELVTHYFTELDGRISGDRAMKVLEAVRMLQFAALRGEGNDPDRAEKRVHLIEDQLDRVPHFVETDESDGHLWTQFSSALEIRDLGLRRRRLRSLRSEIGQRIVEVPRKYAAGVPDGRTGLVHLPRAASPAYYDIETGWRRRS